jgi:hypothetical protein
MASSLMERLEKIGLGLVLLACCMSSGRPATARETVLRGTVLVPAAKCLTWCGDPTEECINAGGSCKVITFRCLCVIPAP